MHGHDLGAGIAETYRAFAEEARDRSPAYERLATAVRDDRVILGFLGSLPPAKRRPNLLSAAARYLLGGAPDPDGLRELAIRDAAGLAGVIMAQPPSAPCPRSGCPSRDPASCPASPYPPTRACRSSSPAAATPSSP
jgi:hypothetical protein